MEGFAIEVGVGMGFVVDHISEGKIWERDVRSHAPDEVHASGSGIKTRSHALGLFCAIGWRSKY
jgi:hypothetical protein